MGVTSFLNMITRCVNWKELVHGGNRSHFLSLLPSMEDSLIML
jgi:hypothetical protein